MLINNVPKVFLSISKSNLKQAGKAPTESFSVEQLTFKNKHYIKMEDDKFYELHGLNILSSTVSNSI
jgi:hypothetical protein